MPTPTASSKPLLRAVATDGHRLARVELGAARGRRRHARRHRAAQDGRRAPQAASRSSTGRVEVALSDTKIRFAFGDVLLTSKLIDGTFPDYERVIPTGNDKVLEVDRKDFATRSISSPRSRPRRSRAVKLALKSRPPDALRHQPGGRHRDRGARGRLRGPADRDRLQLALPARHHAADRRRRARVRVRRCRLADAGARSRRTRPRSTSSCRCGSRGRCDARARPPPRDGGDRGRPWPRTARPARRWRSRGSRSPISAATARLRLEADGAAGGADRPERRRQDQPARGDLVPGAGPRACGARGSPRSSAGRRRPRRAPSPVPGRSRRGSRTGMARRSSSAPGATAPRARPSGAVIRLDGQSQRGQAALAEHVRLRLADAGDGPAVPRRRRRTPPLPRPAGLRLRSRRMPRGSPPTTRRCASGRGCCGRSAGDAGGHRPRCLARRARGADGGAWASRSRPPGASWCAA